MTTDPIADMLTRIRNANLAGHQEVDVPASKIKEEIAKVLKREGFIKDYNLLSLPGESVLRLFLRYMEGKEKVIRGIKRISKPSRRIYVRKDEIPRVLNGLGVAIISTSRGILTDEECRKLGVGGEVICYVW